MPPTSSNPRGWTARSLIGAIGGLIVALVMSGAFGLWAIDAWTAVPISYQPTYVGRNVCAQCHQEQDAAFAGSDHDRAMAVATESTVLGDFEDATFSHHGIENRMYRRDGKFFIQTEGPDGTIDDFEIKYVFGYDPLQQYMVEFDRRDDQPAHEVARVQVLRIAWDTHRKRWFYLPPPDVLDKLDPSDDLHWTGVAQRWNTMCADCHSTNLVRGFDDTTNQYHTTFSEINVSCEACHGPGSLHVKLANRISPFWDATRGYGLAKLKGDNPTTEIETCAACHSRRRVIADPSTVGPSAGDHYCNFFVNETLGPQTYHADGQILDEVYVYGSFIQSRMFHKGIRCTDCHDPHSTRVKHEGNKLCTSCHQHPAGKYDTPAHHHHQPGSPGASCVECHMPETVYMEVDPRRDHSIRIPRPDLSSAIGTPNACVKCHLDPAIPWPAVANEAGSTDSRADLPSRGQYNDHVLAARDGDERTSAVLNQLNQWCAEACDRWYPDSAMRNRDDRRAAEALGDLWFGIDQSATANTKPEGATRERSALASRTVSDRSQDAITLATDQRLSAMARASLVAAIPPVADRSVLAGQLKLLDDADPLVRIAAIASLEPHVALDGFELSEGQAAAAAETLHRFVKPLSRRFDDPRRGVRIEAARVLTRVPPSVRARLLTPAEQARYEAVFAELVTSLRLVNDRASTHLTLGILYEARGELHLAEAAYRTAMRVEPGVVGPRSNLAGLLDRRADRLDRDSAAASLPPGVFGDGRFPPGRDLDAFATDASRELRKQAAALRREELPLIARDARLAPQNADIAYRHGLSLHLAGDSDGAERELQRATELAPDEPTYLVAFAYLLQAREKRSEAMAVAKRLIELRPDDPTYRQLLSEIAPPINPGRRNTSP